MNQSHAGRLSAPDLQGASRVATPGRLRHLVALTALHEAQMRALLGVKLARILSFLVATGFASAMLVLFAAGEPDVLDVLAVRALSWLSWLTAGVAAFTTAGELATRHDQEGLVALALQRGHRQNALARGRSLATVCVVTRVTLVPALSLPLLALALSPSAMAAAGRALLAAAVVGYVALLGVVLGVLARWATMLSQKHGRSVFVALVLGPHLARPLSGWVPSVPAWFDALLDQLLRIGGCFS